MEQRSTLCTHQILNLDSETSDSGLCPDHRFTGNAPDYANRNSHQVLLGPGDTGHVHQFGDYHERVMFYENHYNTFPNRHAYQNIGLAAAGPSNFYNANMLLAPSGRILPVHQNDMMAEGLTSSISHAGNVTNMNGFNRHNQLVDSDGVSSKRKNFEMIPGICYNHNGNASSSPSASYHSINYRLPQWGHSCDYVPGVIDPMSFTPLEYGGRAYLPGADGSQRSMRSRSVATNAQLQPAFLPHQNCLLPGSYVMHPFQDLAWFSHVGNRNNFGDGNSIWNYNNAVRYLQGSGQISETLQMGNVNIQAYTSSSSGINSALLFHPSSMPNFHPTVQNLQVHSYSHPHLPASRPHSVNNLHPVNSRHSGDVLDMGSTLPHFPAGVDQIYRPRRLLQPAQFFNSGSMRFLSSEDDALMDLPGLYEVGNANDQHHDMRLDIDDMSYEDLLALEERIGAVKTGLAEECIMKNLKTRVHIPQETAFTSSECARSFIDLETCSICQVEYDRNDIIGTLDCGHTYHADCIKQWLLIKNLCPICKTAALSFATKG